MLSHVPFKQRSVFGRKATFLTTETPIEVSWSLFSLFCLFEKQDEILLQAV